MSKYLFILNDSPYSSQRNYNALHSSQRNYNALRLVGAMANSEINITSFLLGDGVVNGLRRQSPADASYNAQEMLRVLKQKNVSMGACRTCLEARGIADESLVEGVRRQTLADLQQLTEEADKVLVF